MASEFEPDQGTDDDDGQEDKDDLGSEGHGMSMGSVPLLSNNIRRIFLRNLKKTAGGPGI
jgi:hypothetical protein